MNITHYFDNYNFDFVWLWTPTARLLKVWNKQHSTEKNQSVKMSESIYIQQVIKAMEALGHVSCCTTTKQVITPMLVFGYLAL